MEWFCYISIHHRTMTTIASPTYRRDIHNHNNKCNEKQTIPHRHNNHNNQQNKSYKES